jgi:hypothetical protein
VITRKFEQRFEPSPFEFVSTFESRASDFTPLMPRFVILTHDHPSPHWDLMLEAGDRLRTWRLLEEPAPDTWVPAEPLPDHRLLYLDYEGPVSGDRGHVARWDCGVFEAVHDDDKGLCIVLHGARLQVRADLRLDHPADDLVWEFGPASEGCGAPA